MKTINHKIRYNPIYWTIALHHMENHQKQNMAQQIHIIPFYKHQYLTTQIYQPGKQRNLEDPSWKENPKSIFPYALFLDYLGIELAWYQDLYQYAFH